MSAYLSLQSLVIQFQIEGEKIQNAISIPRANFLKLDIYYAGLKEEVISQSPAYSIPDFLSKC